MKKKQTKAKNKLKKAIREYYEATNGKSGRLRTKITIHPGRQNEGVENFKLSVEKTISGKLAEIAGILETYSRVRKIINKNDAYILDSAVTTAVREIKKTIAQLRFELDTFEVGMKKKR